jgi:hypothetical protein
MTGRKYFSISSFIVAMQRVACVAVAVAATARSSRMSRLVLFSLNASPHLHASRHYHNTTMLLLHHILSIP